MNLAQSATPSNLAIVSLLGALFVIDSLTPLGVVDWILYIIPLLLTSRQTRRGVHPYLVGAICTPLVIIGWITSPPGLDRGIGLLNRVLGIGVLWVVALFLAQRQRAETTLQATGKTLQALIHASPLAITVLDPDGNVTLWNPAAERIFGWPESEALGRPLPLVPDEKQDEFRALRHQVLRGATLSGVELRRQRRDGSEIDITLWAGPLHDARGDVTGIIAVGADSTERKRAEEQLHLQSTALTSAANAIVITDREGRIAWANPAFTDLTGYPVEEVLGQTPRLLKSGQHNAAFYGALWQTILAGEVWHGELINRRKDGSLYTEEQTITPVRDARGAISHFIGIRQDITAQRQAEQALITRTRQLEAIRTVSAEITRELDLPRLLGLIHHRAAELVGMASGAVFLWDEAARILVPQAWHGIGDWFKELRLRLGQGVAGRIAERRVGMIVNDYRNWPHTIPPTLEHTGITAILAEPLLFRDRLLGVITINAQGTERSFTESDRELLALFATQAAIAIENARLFAAVEARAAELEAFWEIDQAITARLKLSAVLEAVVAGAMRLLGTQHAQIILWDEGTQSLRYGAALGTEAERVRNQQFELGRGINGIVAQTRQSMVLDDYQASPYVLPECFDVVATITVPVLFEDRLLAVLHSHTTTPGKHFTPDDLRRFQMLAAQAAIAIENARLFHEVQAQLAKLQAFIGATKLLTSERFLDALLRQAVDQAARAVGAGYGAISLLGEKGTQEFFLTTGMSAEEIAQVGDPPTGRGLLGALVREGRPLRLDDLAADPRATGFPPHHPRLTRFLGVPIISKTSVVGALCVTENARGPFTQEDEILLSSFAEIIAGLIETARLNAGLRQAALQLEAKVEDRTRALQAANEQLAAASRHKSEFLANMSHELRTPLNSIIGFAELLREERVGPLTEKQTRYLGHINQSGKHLLALIGDILDLSKIEAGKIVLQPEVLSVAPLLEDLLALARGLANRKGQEIQIEVAPDLPPLQADPVRVKQICFNLLSNAVKFTPERGTINLTARQASGVGGEGELRKIGGAETTPLTPHPSPLTEFLEIRVTDTGIGIKPEELPRLFQEFVQLEATRDEKREGTGLGLALTKKLVELHGGWIWAGSEGEGMGSTFTVVLPFGGPGGASAAPSGATLS